MQRFDIIDLIAVGFFFKQKKMSVTMNLLKLFEIFSAMRTD